MPWAAPVFLNSYTNLLEWHVLNLSVLQCSGMFIVLLCYVLLLLLHNSNSCLSNTSTPWAQMPFICTSSLCFVLTKWLNEFMVAWWPARNILFASVSIFEIIMYLLNCTSNVYRIMYGAITAVRFQALSSQSFHNMQCILFNDFMLPMIIACHIIWHYCRCYHVCFMPLQHMFLCRFLDFLNLNFDTALTEYYVALYSLNRTL